MKPNVLSHDDPEALPKPVGSGWQLAYVGIWIIRIVLVLLLLFVAGFVIWKAISHWQNENQRERQEKQHSQLLDTSVV